LRERQPPLHIVIAAARGEGDSSKHHKSDSPEFHCFHFDIMFLLNCLQMILLPTDLLMDGTKPKQEQTEWMLFFS
jgi:hypothetical protein